MLRGILAALSIGALCAAGARAADTVEVPGGHITVELSREPAAPAREALMDWIRDSGEAIAAFYGRFPVDELRLAVAIRPGHGIGGGRTWAHDGALIRIRVGEATTPQEYRNDWVLVHEMTHLALPSLPDAHEWLEEGLATYVEPLARAQAGQISDESVWLGIVQGMPKGLPEPGDRGLDRTHTWGRTYWGGALFCLVADLEIRRRTGNRFGLQHALRAILARGNLETNGQVVPILDAGDRATGVTVLAELYARWSDQPVRVDLDALWRDLGVRPDGRSVRLVDDAREAGLRRALTAAPASS